MAIVRTRQAQAVLLGTAALLAGLSGVVLLRPVLTVVGLSAFGAVALVLLAHVHQRTGTTMWTTARLDRAAARHGARLDTLTERDHRQGDERQADDRHHLERALANQTTALRTRWDARLDDLREDLGVQLGQLERHVDDPAGLARRLTALHDRIEPAHARTVAEVDALGQLQRRNPGDDGAVTPLLSRWALAPSAALDVVDHILTRQPALVVECGAGASTLHLASSRRPPPAASPCCRPATSRRSVPPRSTPPPTRSSTSSSPTTATRSGSPPPRSAPGRSCSGASATRRSSPWSTTTPAWPIRAPTVAQRPRWGTGAPPSRRPARSPPRPVRSRRRPPARTSPQPASTGRQRPATSLRVR